MATSIRSPRSTLASIHGVHPAPRQRRVSNDPTLVPLTAPVPCPTPASPAAASRAPVAPNVAAAAALSDLKSLAASFPNPKAKGLTPSLARGARARAALATSTKPAVHPRLPSRRRPVSGDLTSDEEPPSALRQQLARSIASSDKLMDEMRQMSKRVDPAELLLQVPTRYLLVGTCDSRFAGVAKFLPTKIVYAFEHPEHRKVEMHMAYEHMRGVLPRLGGGGGAPGELRFRIVNPLAYFSREYDHTNEAHDLRIGFESVADFRRFEAKVLPHVNAGCGSLAET